MVRREVTYPSILGAIALQGPHQVAKASRTTTFFPLGLSLLSVSAAVLVRSAPGVLFSRTFL
jgi:hypothetical protein